MESLGLRSRRQAAALLVGVTLLLAACGPQKPEEAILGKWVATPVPQTGVYALEFLKDGTLILTWAVNASPADQPQVLQYSVLDNTRIRADMGILGSSVHTFSIE